MRNTDIAEAMMIISILLLFASSIILCFKSIKHDAENAKFIRKCYIAEVSAMEFDGELSFEATQKEIPCPE